MNSRNRVLFFIVAAMFWFAQYVYIPFLTPHLLALNVGAFAVGFIVGAYGFTQMILRIPLGIFADYMQNHMLIIRIGIFFAAVSSVGLMIFPSTLLLFLANSVSGMASSAWISFTVMFSSFYKENEAAKAVGGIIAANNVGILVAYIVGGLLYETTGIEPLFMASFIVGITALFLSFFIPNSKSVKSSVTLKGILSVAKNKSLWLFSSFTSLCNLINFATAVNFSQQMAKELGANGLSLGITSTLYTGGSFCASLFMRRGLYEKLGVRKCLYIGFSLMVVYCVSMYFNSVLEIIYLLQFICGFAASLIGNAMMTMVVKTSSPETKTTAMGFYQSVYSIGMTLGPILMGGFVDLFDGNLSPAFLLIAIISLSAFPLIFFGFRKKDKLN